MAFWTFADAINGAARTYPVLGNDAAMALTYCKEVWREVCNKAQIEEQSESVTLVATQREYTIDTGTQPVEKIQAVYYRESATSAFQLAPVSVDWMDFYAKVDWRTTTDDGTPARYYIVAKDDGTVKIGFDPIPDTSPTAGYPTVVIYGSSYRGALTTATEVPGIVSEIRLLIEGIKWRYSLDHDPARSPLWDSTFQHFLNEFLLHINTQQEDSDYPKVLFSHATSHEIA